MQPDKNQELENDLEFFRKEFNELNQQIRLPNSLEAENMIKLLDNIEPEPQEDKKKPSIYWLRPLASIAACLLIVVGSVFALKGIGGKSSIMESQKDFALPAAPKEAIESDLPMNELALKRDAYYADSYTQLRNAVFEMNGGMDNYINADEELLADGAMEETGAVSGIEEQSFQAPASPILESRSFAAKGSSELYMQENNTNEADLVKSDGKYLYSFVETNSTNSSPIIYIIDPANMQVTAKIPLAESITDFYISGDHLITVGDASDAIPPEKLPEMTIVNATDDRLVKQIGQNSSLDEQQDTSIPRTKGMISAQACIYDISDRDAPKKIKTFAQDGTYISSRMENGILYLVSNYSIYPEFELLGTPLYHLVPAIYDSASGNAQLLDADKVIVNPNSDGTGHTVISAFNIQSGQFSVQSVFGGSDGVYMTNDNLYIYNTKYQDIQNNPNNESTYILRFSILNDQFKFTASGTIPGYLYDRLALNESDGYLRILSTVNLADGSTSNNVYVLNSEMQQTGMLEGIAPQDTIYSVSYVDKRVYFFALGQSNRLFAIDLSNPMKPVQLSEQVISDFEAEFLQPIKQEDLLIGLGGGKDGNGLKLCIFDVSDPMNLRELAAYPIAETDCYTDTLNNPREILFDEAHNQVGVPIHTEDSSGKRTNLYSVFSISRQNGVALRKTIQRQSAGSFGDVNQGITINEILYTFSPEQVVGYRLDTFEPISSIKLA